MGLLCHEGVDPNGHGQAVYQRDGRHRAVQLISDVPPRTAFALRG